MTSLPFDPTLGIGQIVPLSKIEHLKELAEVQKEMDNSKERLDNLLETQYKMKMLYNEMINLGLKWDQLIEFRDEHNKVKDACTESVLEYMTISLNTFDRMEEIRRRQGQNLISASIESPIDYGKSEIINFPLSYDSLHFDVQYHRNEESNDKSYSHSEQLSKTTNAFVRAGPASATFTASSNQSSSSHQGQSMHKIEGTIVLCAKATHRNADIIEPFIMDPVKAVTAWNYTYPEDKIDVDPVSIYKTALEDYKTDKSEKKALSIISGCSKGSSFVGMVHLLKTESTSSTQTASSAASAVMATIEADIWVQSVSGHFGINDSTSNMAKSLNSSSDIECHATMECLGIIPDISESEIASTVMSLDPDPSEIMEQLNAMSEASDSTVNDSITGQAGKAKRGNQFMKIKSDYLQNTVSALATKENANNKIIDMNSMLTSFTNYCNKAMEGNGCGIPQSFYIKQLVKSDIAKLYIRKFYRNGIRSSKDATSGMMAQETEETEE